MIPCEEEGCESAVEFIASKGDDRKRICGPHGYWAKIAGWDLAPFG